MFADGPEFATGKGLQGPPQLSVLDVSGCLNVRVAQLIGIVEEHQDDRLHRHRVRSPPQEEAAGDSLPCSIVQLDLPWDLPLVVHTGFD